MALADHLVGALTGRGINREGAFMEGQLQSAKTTDAIARAKMARDQQAAQERARGIDFTDVAATRANLGDLIAAGYGQDYAAAGQGLLRGQEFDLRAIAANPETDALTRTRSLGAVLGKPYSDIEAVGSKAFTNLTDDSAEVKPLADALGVPIDQPSAIQVYEYWRDLGNPQAQEDFLRTQRGIEKIVDIGGVPTQVTMGPQTTQQALSTLAEETGAARQKAGAMARGKGEEERAQTFIDEGLSAADSLPVINRAIELLETVKTGGIHAARLAATNLLGVTGADEAELSNNLGKAVLSQLRSTFGAQFTEREGARLERIEAGFGKSTAGNLRLLQQIKQLVERAARRGLQAAERSGDTFSADEIRKAMAMRLAPAGKEDGGKPSAAPRITPDTGLVRLSAENADAEYEALPSGAQFIAPDGTVRRKP